MVKINRPKLRNQNHPLKGSHTRVEPIREEKDIQSIRKLLSGNRRDNLLFLLGINNGLRTGDLLKLRVGDVSGLKPGESIMINESKTGKQNVLVINKSVHKALVDYLEEAMLTDDDFLFRSRKGKGAITVMAVNNMVKKWTSTINMKGNYGAHSLRKTWGYSMRKRYGVGFELICKRFNHQSPSVTMRYLGITDREVNDILKNNEVG